MKLRLGMIKVAAIIAALSLTLILVSALIDSNFVFQSLSRVVVILIAAAAIVGLIYLVKSQKLATRLAKQERRYLVAFFIGLIILQLGIYYFIAIHATGWDNETVFRAAGLSAEGKLTDGLRYYLTQFPNNHGVVWLMGAWFKLTSWLPMGWTLRALALNILFVDLCIALVYLAIRKLKGPALAIKSTWLALLFSPFFLYLPLFYTDTLSMPFAIGIFCAYLYLKAAPNITRKYIFAAAIGALAVGAYAIKPTSLCVLIAIVIYELLTAKKFALQPRKILQSLKLPAVTFVVFFSGFLLFSTAQNMVANDQVDPVPWQHYIMMGAQGEGGFSRPDSDLNWGRLDAGDSGAEVARDSWAEYQRRVSEFGPLGYANFLLRKMSYTWGDGTFFAPSILERAPVATSRTWLQEIVLPEGRFFTAFLYLQNGFWLAVLIVFVFGAWRDRKKPSPKLILRLALAGLMVFFLFWETRSRYIVNFVPIFLLLLTLELSDLAAWFRQRHQPRRFKR